MLFKTLALGLSMMTGFLPAAGGDPVGEPMESERGCHRTASGYTCFYGPFQVGPEGKEVLKLVQAPNRAGYITDARATLVNRDNDQVPPHMVHLHHAVWVNPIEEDLTCAMSPGERFFGSGKERTPMRLPDGYGYLWRNQASSEWPYGGRKGWGLTAHLDGMHDMTHGGIFIRLRMGFTPESQQTLERIRPVWLDVNGSCSIDPTFDVPRGSGEDNRFRISATRAMPRAGRFIGMSGHLHDGGRRLILRNNTTGEGVFTARARYDDPDHPWFLTRMTSFYDIEGPEVAAGDELELTAVYDSSRRWEDAMGIMLGALVEQ
ncbi:MAG: hypothetical protein M3198_13015 [Actinomycetota bacterium]|nr:hypothetical protein [Actinomycetota bacterium]